MRTAASKSRFKVLMVLLLSTLTGKTEMMFDNPAVLIFAVVATFRWRFLNQKLTAESK